jgi:hypothetical protein
MRFRVEPADDNIHKYVGIFTDDEGKERRTKFGAKGYEDMTIHKNLIRRSQYLARHRKNEDWYDMYSPGALSRWILWDTSSFGANIQRFKRRFGLR